MATIRVAILLDGQANYRSQVTSLGAAGESAADRIRTGFSKTEQQIIRTIQQTQGLQRQLDQMGGGAWAQQASGLLLTGDAARTATAQVTSLGVAQRFAAGHADEHSFALGRGIRAMEGMSVSAFGLNHHLTTLGVLFAEMGVGHGVVFGAVAAIGLLGFAYEKLTESSREEAKAQADALQALKSFNEEAAAGAGGKLSLDLKKARDGLEELRAKIIELGAAPGTSPTGYGLGAMFNAFREAFGGKTLVSQAAEQTQAITEAQGHLDAKFAQTADAAQLEIDKLRELAQIHGTIVPLVTGYAAAIDHTQLAVDRLNNETEYQNALIKDSVGLNDEQRKKADATALSHRNAADALALLTAQTRDYQSLLKWYSSPEYKAIEDAERFRVVSAGVGSAVAAMPVTTTSSTDPTAYIGKLVPPDISNILNEFKKAYDYSVAIHDIWTKGIEQIAQHGLQSFSSFFDGVLNLFRRLMVQMEAAGKQSTTSYQALQLASAGLAGGMIGYQSGSPFTGAVGGATAGAAITGGPWGAVIGGLAGAAGGLLSAAQEQHAAAAAFVQAIAALNTNIDAFSSTTTDLADKIRAVQDQATNLRANVGTVYAGGSATPAAQYASAVLDRINAAEAARIKLLQQEDAALRVSFTQDLAERNLRAAGLNDQADAYAFALQQQREMTDAVTKYGQNSAEVQSLVATQSAEATARLQALAEALDQTLSNSLMSRLFSITGGSNLNIGAATGGDPQNKYWYDLFNKYLDQIDQAKKDADGQKAIDQLNVQLQQQQLAVLQKTLQTQQQSVSALQSVVDNIKKFRDSLSLDSALTILSPKAQLDAAARQYHDLLAKAMTGDQVAAGAVTGAAQQYATIGKSYYGSTSGYVGIYNDIQAGTGALGDQFGAQLDTQQSILAELQKQTDIMNAQVGQSRDQQRNSDISMLIQRMGYEQTMSGGTGRADWQGDNLWLSLLLGSSGTLAEIQADRARQVNLAQRQRQALIDGTDVPSFAIGGDHRGGIMRVHDGELIATGPARVLSKQQLAAGSGDVVAELRALRAEFRQLTAATKDGARSQRLARRARDN